MKKKKIKLLATAGVFVIICILAAWAAGGKDFGDHSIGWMSILPPLLAVSLALATEKLIPSLAISVVIGGLLASVARAPAEFASWGQGLVAGPKYFIGAVTDPFNLQILAFVVLVMALISVVVVAGGVQAIILRIARYAKGPRSTQIVTVLMGIAVFIDDYTNTMIVGSAMRPLSDRNRISREKLAFLVDATSAPISGVAVISTWIGYEVGLFGKAAQSLGIAKDGYSIFFDALPFRFYCFMMLAFVLANVFSGKDFGLMRKAQKRAEETGQLSEPDAVPMSSNTFSALAEDPKARSSIWTAILPFIALFGVLIIGLWRDGGGFDRSFLSFFNPLAWRDVISGAENNILILAYSAGAGLLVALGASLAFSKLPFPSVLRGAMAGIKGSLLPVIILLLAWSLKASCDAVGTGNFLVSAVGGVLSPVWFPAILFIVAGATAFATGTSWGTMAILIPTATPLAFSLDGDMYGLVTMMSLAAILDGAIFGDHCSPISDTTIMSSISSSCDHIHHVRTQMPYAVTVGALALMFGYLPSALGLHPGLGLLLSFLAIAAVFWGVLRNGATVGTRIRQASASS